MKNIISMMLMSTSIMFFGCNGDSSFENELQITPLSVGQEMIVQEGDKLVTGEDTVINVVHEVDSTLKKVTLISGTAELLKGDYVVVN